MTEDAALVYDTHAAVRRSIRSGMPEPQAVAVVDEQVGLLKRNLANRAGIEKSRLETAARIEAAKSGIIKWMIGVGVAAGG